MPEAAAAPLRAETPEDRLAAIDALLDAIGAARPALIVAEDGAGTGTGYKAGCAAAALLWRAEELGRCARALLGGRDVGAALILTRALIETSAALWYLMRLVERNAEAPDRDCDDKVTRLLVGTKSDDGMPDAINVLTMLGHAEKDVPQVEAAYAGLCEFAHPNWAGTGFVYTWVDPEAATTYFGTMHRAHVVAKERCLAALLPALAMAQIGYGRIGAALPTFAAATAA